MQKSKQKNTKWRRAEMLVRQEKLFTWQDLRAHGNYFTLPTDTVLHSEKYLELTNKDWQSLVNNFDDITFYTPVKQTPKYDGQTFLGTYTEGKNNYGVVAEYFDNGDFRVTTLFKDKPQSIETG